MEIETLQVAHLSIADFVEALYKSGQQEWQKEQQNAAKAANKSRVPCGTWLVTSPQHKEFAALSKEPENGLLDHAKKPSFEAKEDGFPISSP
jgi:hypothetical protein